MQNKRKYRGHRGTRKGKSDDKESLLLLFNKPFNTLCQFTGEESDTTLSDFINIKKVYPAGRLDKDSEGLLILTNNGQLQNKICSPEHKMIKRYLVQVEGDITSEALLKLAEGVELKDGLTKKAEVRLVNQHEEYPDLWQRTPNIRIRKNIPTRWIELSIREGKNRQVRRMTAAVGFPTLRLIRVSIGNWQLSDIKPGEYRVIPHLQKINS